MADLLPYSTDTVIDPVTGLATVTVTSYGERSQQYQASYTSAAVGQAAALAPPTTIIQEAAAVVKSTTNAEAIGKSTPSKTVTKVSTPKTH